VFLRSSVVGRNGGMLAQTDNTQLPSANARAYYQADGSGNITYLVNSSQGLAARYRYDPYGNTISSSGTYAGANTYRFSSKMIDAQSGFYYYGYRWYAPNLQRWLNRDPLNELGFRATFVRDQVQELSNTFIRGENAQLYTFVENNALNLIDAFGLTSLPPGWHGPGKPYDPKSNPFCSPAPPCANLAAALAASITANAFVCAGLSQTPAGRAACRAHMVLNIVLFTNLRECMAKEYGL
jgi:RHS repeat-associated protein